MHQEKTANLTTTSHISPQQAARFEESFMLIVILALYQYNLGLYPHNRFLKLVNASHRVLSINYLKMSKIM